MTPWLVALLLQPPHRAQLALRMVAQGGTGSGACPYHPTVSGVMLPAHLGHAGSRFPSSPKKPPCAQAPALGRAAPGSRGSLPTLCHPTPLSHEHDPTPRCRRAVPGQIRRERLRGRVVRQRLQGHHGPGASLAPAEPPREEPAQLAAGDAGHATLRPAALPGHRPHRLAEVGTVPRVPAPPPK